MLVLPEFTRPLLHRTQNITLREKYPYLVFFWSVFSYIRAEYREMQNISPYSVQMRENTDQKTPNTETFHALLKGNIWHLWSCKMLWFKTHFWPILQSLPRAAILPWIGTEFSNFQVNFHSKVAFNDWYL